MLAEDVRHPERQPMSSKGGRTKDKKRDKEVGMEIHPGKGVLKKRGFQTPGNTHQRVCGKPWNLRGQHNQEEK